MKDKLIIIMGPTAVGKTNLSIEIAKKVNGEIISADSMQIYKYMDIGTAKVKDNEMFDIPHHMLDIIYPDETFSVSDYQERAKDLIRKINEKGKIPIVVGGTGLYINSLVYDLNFGIVPPNQDFRDEMEALANKHGNEYIYSRLLEIDPMASKGISVNDRKRIIRALEICTSTKKTLSEYNEDFRKEVDDYDLFMFCLNMDREKLYSRINYRVDLMLEEGLLDEVKSILSKGYKKELVSLQGIGYKELIMYLEGDLTLNEAIDLIKQKSRNYAKRQLTWFRRDKRINWIDVDSYESLTEIKADILNIIFK